MARNLAPVALVVGLLALVFSLSLHLQLWRRRPRKRARDIERELDAVFAHALDAILTLDDQGTCVDANPAAFAILGAPHSVLIGRSFAQFHEDRQEFGAGFGAYSSSASITRDTLDSFDRMDHASSCTTRWRPTTFPDTTS